MFLASDTDDFTCKWSNDRGLTYNILPAMPVDEYCAAGFARWSNGILQSLLVGTQFAAPAEMYMWSQGFSSWVDKVGNLGGFGVGKVFQVDRDSMGTA